MSYPDFDCYPIDELECIGRKRLVTIDLKEEDLVFRSMKYRLLALWLLDELAKIPLTETGKCDNLESG